jgi:hypothetical protein
MNAEGNAQERREQRLKLLEDDIGRHLAQAHASGELAHAKSYGKPLDLGDGYDETPAELRMGMKILKDAGVVPPEVELMQRIEALQRRHDADPAAAGAPALLQEVAALRLQLSLRLEHLRRSGTL